MDHIAVQQGAKMALKSIVKYPPTKRVYWLMKLETWLWKKIMWTWTSFISSRFATRIPAQDPSNTEPEDHKARQRDSLGASCLLFFSISLSNTAPFSVLSVVLFGVPSGSFAVPSKRAASQTRRLTYPWSNGGTRRLRTSNAKVPSWPTGRAFLGSAGPTNARSTSKQQCPRKAAGRSWSFTRWLAKCCFNYATFLANWPKYAGIHLFWISWHAECKLPAWSKFMNDVCRLSKKGGMVLQKRVFLHLNGIRPISCCFFWTFHLWAWILVRLLRLSC